MDANAAICRRTGSSIDRALRNDHISILGINASVGCRCVVTDRIDRTVSYAYVIRGINAVATIPLRLTGDVKNADPPTYTESGPAALAVMLIIGIMASTMLRIKIKLIGFFVKSNLLYIISPL